MSAAAFVAEVLGAAEAAAVLEAVEPEDVAAAVAVRWISGFDAYAGSVPGTGIEVTLIRDAAGWRGVLPGVAFSGADVDTAAAAVAAAVAGPPRGDARGAAAVAPGIAARDCRRATPRDPAPPAPPPESRHAAPRRPAGIVVRADLAARRCAVCAEPQIRDDALVGCTCLAALVATAEIRAIPQGFAVTPGPDWDAADRATFVLACHG